MSKLEPTTLSKTMNHEGVPVRWTSFGTGPPLIFLHGTPWSSRIWTPIARCFALEFTVYLYDMPGYGESIPPSNSNFQPSYPEQAKAFCALLDVWQSHGEHENFRPHVVAHDIGGHIALRALLIEGRSFASLALVDCGAAFPVDEPFFSLVRENASVFQSMPSYLHTALAREYISKASFKSLRKDQEDMLLQPWVSSSEGQHGFYAQIAAQLNEDIEELRRHYVELGIPLHIIWARNDSWVPVERAYLLQRAIGGSLRIVEEAGHLIQLDAPEALTTELVKWLQTVRGK